MSYLVKDLSLLPAERALGVIAGRWKVVLLYHLFSGPKRLCELRRLVPGISQKVLIQQLQALGEHGLVVQAPGERARHYEITDEGRALQPILAALCAWGRAHGTRETRAVDRACAAVGLGQAP